MGSVKPLPSREELKVLLEYSPHTGELVWRERSRCRFSSDHQWRAWNARNAGRKAFTGRGASGFMGSVNRVIYYAHRLIWKMQTGCDPDVIDHINGDPFDNRWINLRNVSQAQNVKNSSRRKDNKSGVTGAHRRKGKFVAYIRSEGNQSVIGTFETLEAASSARKARMKELGFHPNHGRQHHV
ncbi:MAG: HNH endonuclease [Mameliella sp.]|nr:HNH endonuclease [Mameliella sp.]